MTPTPAIEKRSAPPSTTAGEPLPAATLRGVVKQYGPITALDGVDLALPRGRITALLGPNGAGKTTAVQLLLGLARPTAGEVRLLGGDPRDPAVRRRRGAMLQVSKVPENLKVREHLELFSSYYPRSLPLDRLARETGLTEILDRPFGELSGGQRQRLLFALAVCGDPELLCLDEPTVGLDVEARRALWRQIRSFADRGGTVLLTTHYLAEAEVLADRIAVLFRGAVIAQGSPEEIRDRVAARRIRCVTGLSAETLRSLPGVHSVELGGRTSTLLAGDAERVVAELLARDPHLSGLEVAAAGLEDAFLALTRVFTDTEPPALGEA